MTQRIIRAIVTGHTRGLGAALAEQLLSRNIAVLALSRSRNAALAQRYPQTIEEIELDLANPERVAQWIAGDTLRRFVDGADTVLLINNAGVVQPIGPLETQDAADIASAIGLNVATPMMLASAVATASVNASDRRIVHISSGAGRNAYPGWSIYCATKAALDHHARSCRPRHQSRAADLQRGAGRDRHRHAGGDSRQRQREIPVAREVRRTQAQRATGFA